MSIPEVISSEKLSTISSGELFPHPCESNNGHDEDYYIDQETGFMVFTAKYHLKRSFCCGSGCRHCPFSNTEK